ncbi:translation initiation factor 2 [Actinoplanes sp. GCM10030250]|uniref:translation initiation factor 2 n=1 Tax=Actinoplanes sp. GCM10030250 TaxID=3273376 RepID=UPI00361390BC
MFHQHFLSASSTDLGPLDDGERVLWQGHCAVAEYGFDEASSLPRWTLPEATGVLVTDRRIRYTYADATTQSSGEMFWLWPQHLRVQPGNRETGRNATVTQIQLVCNGPDGSFPALVFAGGDLGTVADADRLANVMRQAIARFRVEYADEIGVPAPQARMLSRLAIGPEFNNYQGGQGQTVTMLGAVPVPAPEVPEPQPAYAEVATSEQPAYQQPTYEQPAYQQPVHEQPAYEQPAYEQPAYEQPAYRQPAYEQPAYDQPAYQQPAYQQPMYAEPVYAEPVSAMPTSGSQDYALRPGLDDDAIRAEQAVRAEQDSRYAQPDLASRAASLAARVASLVSGNPDENDQGRTTNLSAYLSPRPDADPGRQH